jgi:putative two-component system response regulator
MKSANRPAPLVLVADDQPANLELMEAYLEALGCNVATAADGAEVMDLVSQVIPDVVLLDAMMPQLDGFEVCRRLKAGNRTRLLPVVMVTALNNTSDRVRALEAGADDFLAKPVDRTELTARVRSLLRLKSLYDELDDAEAVIFALAKAVEAKDHYTEAHTERVACNAQALALIAGIPEADLRELYRGAMVHDIGKIGVPDAILLKPGPLNDDEWEAMKKHPSIGERIARPLRSATRMLPIIRNHHERVDGLGYPDAMHGDEIPLGARIVAICDAYDAMTSDRPYRPGRTAAEAAAILRDGAGTQWDKELVHLFLDQVEREVG